MHFYIFVIVCVFMTIGQLAWSRTFSMLSSVSRASIDHLSYPFHVQWLWIDYNLFGLPPFILPSSIHPPFLSCISAWGIGVLSSCFVVFSLSPSSKPSVSPFLSLIHPNLSIFSFSMSSSFESGRSSAVHWWQSAPSVVFINKIHLLFVLNLHHIKLKIANLKRRRSSMISNNPFQPRFAAICCRCWELRNNQNFDSSFRWKKLASNKCAIIARELSHLGQEVHTYS